MQYLVNEVRGRGTPSPNGALSFDTVADVMKHLKKVSKNRRLLIGDKEANIESVLALLPGKLSTVSISLERQEGGEERTWTIIAF